jgi:DNA-binding response OmpR family regulator
MMPISCMLDAGDQSSMRENLNVKQLRILVLEDDEMIAMVLCAMLEEMGHAICALETTVAGGVSAAAKERPDLMIVDARLGRESGVSAVEEVLRNGFVPHFFVSGNAAAVKALKPDATVLEKPFREEQLAQVVRLVCESRAGSLEADVNGWPADEAKCLDSK